MELDEEAAAAIARIGRLAEKLERIVEERPLAVRQPETLLDARQVAVRLGVTRDWVYEHADELGAIRIGSGTRPRLRFPADVGMPGRDDGRTREEPTKHPATTRKSGLIPIYDG